MPRNDIWEGGRRGERFFALSTHNTAGSAAFLSLSSLSLLKRTLMSPRPSPPIFDLSTSSDTRERAREKIRNRRVVRGNIGARNFSSLRRGGQQATSRGGRRGRLDGRRRRRPVWCVRPPRSGPPRRPVRGARPIGCRDCAAPSLTGRRRSSATPPPSASSPRSRRRTPWNSVVRISRSGSKG